MKALLIYPEFPDTFWSFRHALKFINRKASSPPLGLLTIAAMLPEAWEKRLVDMNVESLHNDHLMWADLVFVSAMSVQKESVKGAKVTGSGLLIERAQQRVAHSNWWKSSHGKSQSHVAWMAGGDGNVAF
jgi:hypothetical protein